MKKRKPKHFTSLMAVQLISAGRFKMTKVVTAVASLYTSVPSHGNYSHFQQESEASSPTILIEQPFQN